MSANKKQTDKNFSLLSTQQKRMWFLENVSNKKSAYNITIAFEIKGKLCIESLQQAYNLLLPIHTILMISFIETNCGLKSKINENIKINIGLIDLSSYASADRTQKINDILKKYNNHSFRLEQAPLFFIKLLKVDDNEYVLINTFHHIIIDGWSFKILYNDISLIYNQIISNSPLSIKKPVVNYNDYVMQELFRSNNEINDDKIFWKEYIDTYEYAKIPANLYWQARKSSDSDTLAKSRIEYISKNDTLQIESLSLRLNVTLYSTMLAIYAMVFAHFCSKNNFFIGTPIANRNTVEYEDIIGLFVNTLPIKINIDNECSYESIIKTIANSALSCFNHQKLPFDEIVNLVQSSKNPHNNPLFNTMFVIQDDMANNLNLSGTQSKIIDSEIENLRFDFESTFWRTASGLKWRIIYNTTLYTENFIDEFIFQFNNLLHEILKSPQSLLTHHTWLKSNQLIKLLAMGQGKKQTFPVDKHCNIVRLIAEIMQKYPDNVALVCELDQLTYSELHDNCCCYKAYLCEHFSNTNECINIAVSLSRSTDLIIAILSIISLGHTLVPINTDDSAERIEHILKNTKVRAIISNNPITTEKMIDKLDIIKLSIPKHIGKNVYKKKPFYEGNINSNSLIYIIHTSGTTGLPKGVMVSHLNLFHTLTNLYQSYDFSALDCFGCISSFSFDIFYFESLIMFLCGGKTRLITQSELMNVNCMFNILNEITAIQAVPSLMNQINRIIEQSNLSQLDNLRFVTTGGETVSPFLFNKLVDIYPNAQVSITYGPTEATIICCKQLADKNYLFKIPVLGRPLPNTEVRICNSDNNLVPMYIPGEIYIAGPSVTQGYMNQTELTLQQYIKIKGKRYYRTGDIGRWLDNGVIEYLGRMDDQIKLRGFRIELDAINHSLLSYPKIAQAVTILQQSHLNDKHLVSYITLNINTEKMILSNFVSERIEHWKKLFDQTHHDVEADINITHDFTGWKSVISGEDIPRKEMGAWLNASIKAINKALSSTINNKKLTILEVGCGTGLLVSQLLERATLYHATDFSSRILHTLNKRLQFKNIENIELQQCAAHEIDKYFTRHYDLIILNSVVQYFPSLTYLTDVLSSILKRMNSESTLFIGDVRDFRKLPILNANILLHNKILSDKPQDERNDLLNQRSDHEHELCIDPLYFYKTFSDFDVQTSPRLDSSSNELSLYRYNVIIKLRAKNSHSINWITGNTNEVNGQLIKNNIKTHAYFAIKNIPDIRLHKDIKNYEEFTGNLLNFKKPNRYKKSLLTLSPYELLNWADRNKLNIAFYYHPTDGINCYSLIISSKPMTFDIFDPDKEMSYTHKLANSPIESMVKQREKKSIRIHLAKKLAPYMLPERIEIIDKMPVTIHGKIDKSQLKKMDPQFKKIKYRKKISETESTLIESLKSVINTDEIDYDDDFFESGGSSLLAIQWAIELRKFNISISPQDVFQHRTIGDIANFIDTKINLNRPHNTNNQNELQINHKNFNHNNIKNSVNPSHARILLLGSTGYLGAHVLYELIQLGCKEIYCIVRTTESQSALERLSTCYHHYFKLDLPNNITVLNGNISHFRLGLSMSDWHHLSNQCNIVINCAANVRHVAHASDIFSVNTYGVSEILELLDTGIKKYFFHTSTVGVKGLNISACQEKLTENDLDIGQTHTEEYSLSKFHAEKIISGYIAKDNFAKVFRIGTIAPHSKQGYFQKNIEEHFLSRFIHSIVCCGAAPIWENRVLALTPVDVIANIIVKLIFSDETTLNVYHIETTHTTTYAQLARALHRYGYNISIVHPDIFNSIIDRLIKADSNLKEKLSGIIQLIDASKNKNIVLESKLTHSILSSYHLGYPSYTQEYIYNFIQHCIDCGYLIKPKNSNRKMFQEKQCVE